MGSSGGWDSFFGGIGNLVTGGYLGQKKVARAQARAASDYAAGQERVAQAIEQSSSATPQAVQASSTSAQQAAEADFYAAQKRRRTIATTANSQFAGMPGNNKLGSLGGRTTL